MPLSALSGVVATAARSAAPPTTDGELLCRYVRSGEEAAFAALVRRLGPMVLAVCRRVSRDSHLAEDAFQAAFVVLAGRAADVRPAEGVRAWLHGVAVRTARGVRAVSARRLAREAPLSPVPDRAAEAIDPPDAEAMALLDEEVAALPEHLRVAVVLCELEGASRKEAAARLGIAEGTLSSRLAKARKLLAERLRKRGVCLPAAGLAVLASSANVSARLAARTSALASAGAPLPASVAVLSQGVFRTMYLKKLTLGVACGVALAAAAVMAANAIPVSAQEPARPRVPLALANARIDDAKPQPAAKPAAGKILLVREGPYHVLTPDGTKESELTAPKGTRGGGPAVLSPDGKRVAFMVDKEGPPRVPLRDGETPEPWPFKVAVTTLDKADSEKAWDMPSQWLTMCWTADGKKIVVGKHPEIDRGKNVENLLLDPETGKTEALKLPAGAWVLDAAKDGKTFLVALPAEKKLKIGFAAAGDEAIRDLGAVVNWPPGNVSGRLSPDGTKVLLAAADPSRKDAHKWGVSQRPYLLDVKTKKMEPLAEFPDNGQVRGIAWSPDGKRVAYTWHTLHEELLKKDSIKADEAAVESEAFLIVADADGKNPKTIASGKGQFALNMIFGAVDWR